MRQRVCSLLSSHVNIDFSFCIYTEKNGCETPERSVESFSGYHFSQGLLLLQVELNKWCHSVDWYSVDTSTTHTHTFQINNTIKSDSFFVVWSRLSCRGRRESAFDFFVFHVLVYSCHLTVTYEMLHGLIAFASFNADVLCVHTVVLHPVLLIAHLHLQHLSHYCSCGSAVGELHPEAGPLAILLNYYSRFVYK